MTKSVNILVVDDQVGMLETFTDILGDRGYNVAVAEDGYTAIDKVKKGAFDVIFMDIKMPGINGVQTFREIKKINLKTAVIEIIDTGSGIPKEYIHRVFEPFFTTREAGAGTGLGLSIVYSIIRDHNGDIKVRSEVGKGTTFTIKLPI